MKTLVLFIMMFSSVAYSQLLMPNPMYNDGSCKGAVSLVPLSIAVTTYGINEYTINSPAFQELSQVKKNQKVATTYFVGAALAIASPFIVEAVEDSRWFKKMKIKIRAKRWRGHYHMHKVRGS